MNKDKKINGYESIGKKWEGEKSKKKWVNVYMRVWGRENNGIRRTKKRKWVNVCKEIWVGENNGKRRAAKRNGIINVWKYEDKIGNE